MEEGPPTSYLLLGRQTPVYGSDGAVVGTVKEVLCEPSRDIFDGLVLATDDGDRLLGAEFVAAIHECGVDVALSASQVGQLPQSPRRRQVKFDVGAHEHRWLEILHWLCEHMEHVAHPGDPRLTRARAHLAERERALSLARENPRLALEAGVGRPDLPGSYHGGLIDVNHAPHQLLGSLPGVDAELAGRLIAAREELDGFSSLEDLGSVLDLSGPQVEHLRERVVFLPR